MRREERRTLTDELVSDATAFLQVVVARHEDAVDESHQCRLVGHQLRGLEFSYQQTESVPQPLHCLLNTDEQMASQYVYNSRLQFCDFTSRSFTTMDYIRRFKRFWVNVTNSCIIIIIVLICL